MRQDWGQLFNFPRIQLAMPIRHLLKLFQISFPGANEGRGWTYQPPSFDKLMQKFSGVRYLEIYFESTLDPVGSNPWGVYWHDTDSQVDCAIYPCRKTLLDWIVLFIFPHVQHIASVSLTGFVKNCTREKWLARLGKGADRRQARENVAQEMAELRRLKPADL